MKNLGKKFGAALEAANGDAGKALAYLKERVWMMDYRLLRKNGYYQVDGTPHDYDLVIGPTADDDTRLLMKNYVDGVYGDPDDPAAKDTLLRLLKPERLGIQWFVSRQSVVDRLVGNLAVVDWRECV